MIDARQPDFSNHPAAALRARYSYTPRLPQPPVTVSILTAFFNTDAVFLETATSILAQSFQEWEWIVVDDGSTDPAALQHLNDVGRMDPRIRLLRQENRGPAAARNTAFAASSGRYLCLLDSDDLIEPTFLEKTLWFLESQPSFSFCNSWSVTFGSFEYLLTTGFEWGKAHIKANSGPFHSVMRRQAYAEVGGFDETIRFGHEDWDFWLALANKGHWGHTLPEYLEWYRRRPSGRHAQVVNSAATHRQFQHYIRNKYKGLPARFPDPQLRAGKPFESVSQEMPFANSLVRAATDRRILFLIPWMVTGGADRVNLEWTTALTQRGFQVSICATLKAAHEWMPEFAAITPDIFVLPNFLHPADFPRFIVYLIQSRGIDTVLVSNCTLGYQLLPYLRSSCAGVTFTDLSHVEELYWLNGGHPRFGIGYQDQLDLNIVTTENLRRWMGKAGADTERIAVCYTGTSLQPLTRLEASKATLREALGISSNVPLLVYAGRICEQKRPELLASVLKSLAEHSIPFHCLVIGDGPLMPLLKKRIAQYRLRNAVTLLGTLPHQKWLEALAASDIFFLPSMYEGISVALFEAMAMKVVPVMSAVGGQPEIVTAECGILVSLGDGEMQNYICALKRLIESPHDRQMMAAACYQRVAGQFTLETSIGKFIDTLNRAKQLAITCSRPAVPMLLATELATQAIEYARLTTDTTLSGRLAKILRWMRTHKAGRVLLRMRWIRIAGKRILDIVMTINK